jgi:hypothetical protein
LSLISSPSKPFLTTSVKDATLCPVWNESGWVYVPNIPAKPMLHVEIMNSNKFGQHDVLGNIEIPLNTLTSGNCYDRWHRIQGQKSSAGMLSVTVRRATDLPAMDRNGKSDPYCVLSFVNEQRQAISQGTRNLVSKHADGGISSLFTSQGAQTRVIHSDLNPIWEESFLLDVPSHNVYLQVQCYDHDTFGRHDLLGTGLIPVSSIVPYVPAQQWILLQVPEGLVPRNALLMPVNVQAGSVLVEMCFAPSSPHSCPDGSLRLCLQLLDKTQLGVAVDGPPDLGMAFADRPFVSTLNERLDLVEKALEDRLQMHANEGGHRQGHTSDEWLLHNESYLAWAARSSGNIVPPGFP